MTRRQRYAIGEDESAMGEINLIPYMDIVVNLILFLMLSSTGLIQYAVVNVTAPEESNSEAQPSQAPPQVVRLGLTAAVTRQGVYLMGEGAGLTPLLDLQNPPSFANSATDGGMKIDFSALQKRLIELKNAAPKESSIVITAEPAVPYESVIQIMDCARQDAGGRILFPDVMLSPWAAPEE